MKRLLFSLALCIVFSVYSISSHAAILNGYEWPTRSVSYQYYSNASYRLRNAVTTAANSWTNSTVINYFYTSASTPNVFIDENPFAGAAWDGITTYGDKVNGFLSFVGININTVSTADYSATAFLSVVCHELGHAIGLDDDRRVETVSVMIGYSDKRYDIQGIYSPQQDDIRDVYTIYGNKTY